MSDNLEDLVIIEDDQPQLPLLEKIKKWPMSYYIVAINIIVFVMVHLTNLLIADQWFVIHFAKFARSISVDKEYYRLFTAIFTHEAPMHLLFNCYAVIILGKPIEIIFGKWKFLLIFLISGLFGSLTSFIFSASYSIGASGGVFGIFGVHLYLFLKNKETYLKIFGKDMFQLLILNVIIGFVMPNIDYYGHFGGILGGFLASLSFGLTHTIKVNKSFVAGLLATVLIFVGSFTYFNNILVNYYSNEGTYIEEFNAIIRTNNLVALKQKREEIVDSIPNYPPIYGSDELIEQMDDIIKKFK